MIMAQKREVTIDLKALTRALKKTLIQTVFYVRLAIYPHKKQ